MTNFRSNYRILCAIPCYNEGFNLPSLLVDLNQTELTNVDFVFIDDGSKDNTRELIENSGYKYIFHATNGGYGKAVQTGFKYAVEQKYDGFVIFPGDHQRSAKDLRRLIDLFLHSDFDVVTGSKFHIYSEKYGPIRRRIGNRIFSSIARIFWQSPIEDVLSGFKIYRVNAVRDFFFRLPVGYPFDIVFSLYAAREGLKVTEIPVDCRYDDHTSKMRSVLWVSFLMFSHLFIHYFFRPLLELAPEKVPASE